MHYVTACDEAHATSNINDILIIPECCTDSTQCCTEENEAPAAAAETIMIIYQVIIIQCDHEDRNGYWKKLSLPKGYSNSKLV